MHNPGVLRIITFIAIFSSTMVHSILGFHRHQHSFDAIVNADLGVVHVEMITGQRQSA